MANKVVLEKIITEKYTLETSIDDDVLAKKVSDFKALNLGKTDAEAKKELKLEVGRIDTVTTSSKPLQGIEVLVEGETLKSV